MIYQKLPSWILGFHGTDTQTVYDILTKKTDHLNSSTNLYDWLGDGVYFWENDPKRALQFAKERMAWKKEKKVPAVIGAVIDLGLCMNLSEQEALGELAFAHRALKTDLPKLGSRMPVNGTGKNRWAHHLDCAVITKVHELRELMEIPEYQTVRCAFKEGAYAFPGTEDFQLKNHVQIAVRKPQECIKGYFLPLDLDVDFSLIDK